jgi:hypothetical protein
MTTQDLDDLTARLVRIEKTLDLLVQQRAIKRMVFDRRGGKTSRQGGVHRARMVPAWSCQGPKEEIWPWRRW